MISCLIRSIRKHKCKIKISVFFCLNPHTSKRQKRHSQTRLYDKPNTWPTQKIWLQNVKFIKHLLNLYSIHILEYPFIETTKKKGEEKKTYRNVNMKLLDHKLNCPLIIANTIARHCAKHFRQLLHLILKTNLKGKYYELPSDIYRNWNISGLPKVRGRMYGRTGIQNKHPSHNYTASCNKVKWSSYEKIMGVSFLNEEC